MSMVNLLEETIEFLEECGKSEDDITYVLGKRKDDKDYWTELKFMTSWELFKSIAKNTEYDNGFGGNYIAMGLKIVGKTFWLERNEYDGSEWWEYKEFPNLEDYEYTQDETEIKNIIGIECYED